MGIFDTIGDALGGKVPATQGGDSNTKTTRMTPRDIAITQQRRNSPEFQAALRARAQQDPGNPANFAFQPPVPTAGGQ